MKRFLSACLSVLIICCIVCQLPASAVTFTPNFETQSQAAMLINLDNDQVLYQKNVDKQFSPGSLVQIMVAIVVLENCTDLRTNITVDDALYAQFENTTNPDDLRYAEIEHGDIFSVEELLYAMMLTSSCEASVVLANHFGDGNIAAFVGKMNEKAAELGCTQTHFTNVTGLPTQTQLTTVRDLSVMTKYALSLGRFEEISTAASFTPYTPNFDNHEVGWTWTHSNTMMQSSSNYYMEGVKGIKTANLTDQGRSIICKAARDGNTYLAILLAAPFDDLEGNLQFYHLEDAKALFNWAFTHFSYQTILSENTELGQISVQNGDGVDYVLVKPASSYMTLWYDTADTAAIVQDVKLDENVSAPVEVGEKLGTVTLKYSGEVIATVDLVATSAVELSKFKYYLALVQHFPKTSWLWRSVLVSLLLCAIYIAVCVYSHVCYKQKLKPIEPVHLKPRVAAVKKEASKAPRKPKKKEE